MGLTLCNGFSLGAVDPPFNVAGVFQPFPGIVQIFQAFRIEDADDAQRVGELLQTSVELVFQLTY